MSRTFKVWNPGEGETEQDGDTITGDGASDAAELWAEDTDERDSEFPIATGQTPTVHVRHMDGPARGCWPDPATSRNKGRAGQGLRSPKPATSAQTRPAPARGKIEQFKVTGEFTATYTARSLDEPDPEQA